MNFIKNISLSILTIIGFILVLTFIMTIFSYLNIIGDNTISIFKIIIPILSLFIGGLFLGIKMSFYQSLKLAKQIQIKKADIHKILDISRKK